MLGTSYLGIFGPLLATDWVLARTLVEANRVCTVSDLVLRAMGA